MQGNYGSRNRFSNRGRGNGGRRGNRGPRRGASFNMSQFINKDPIETQAVEYTPEFQFSDLNIDNQIKNNILRKGYKTPTPIQDKTIPLSLAGKDVIGLANTGTGKSAAFLIPLIDKVIKNRNERVLIIAPTRELAVQIEEEFRMFADMTRIYSATCIGGASMGRQMNDLRRNPNFVIGTPGRLLDLYNRRCLDLSRFGNIVLDEVDRMMDMGFMPDIKEILSYLQPERQSLFFSATMPDEIKRIAYEYMKDPITVSVVMGSTAKNIYQDVILHNKHEDKLSLLTNLFSEQNFDKVLVFAATKRYTDVITRSLNDQGIRSTSIHGDKSQGQRQRSLQEFKSDRVRVLVATDVAARGLDISDVSHVINFDLPQSYEDYVHRIGRTGRAGKSGVALTFFERSNGGY